MKPRTRRKTEAVDKVRTEQAEQLRMIYEQHRTDLFVFALSITRCKQSAEDAVHQAFQNILAKGNAPDALRPYVFRSVRNAALDELRSIDRRGRRDSIFAAVQNREPTPPAMIPSEIDELLDHLSSDERECVVLKLWSGLSLREIAETRNASPNTVASWYRRGLNKLRTKVEEVEA